MDSRYKKGCILFSCLAAASLACGPGVAEGPLPVQLSAGISGDAEASQGPPRRDGGEDGPDSADADAVGADADRVGLDADSGRGHADSAPDDGCPEGRGEVTSVISAHDVGDDVRFVGLGSHALSLLAEQTRDGVVEPVLVFLDALAYERGRATLAQSPTASVRGIAVANRGPAPFGANWPYAYEAVVLVRAETGNALYGADSDPDDGMAELLWIEDSQVPPDLELRGLVYLPDKMPGQDAIEHSPFNRLCAFGDGVFCLSADGSSWSRNDVIEPATGAPFNSLTAVQMADEWLLFAVGDQGRMVRASLESEGDSGSWQELSSGTSENLLAITAKQQRLAAAGDRGTVVHLDVSSDVSQLCNISDQRIVSLSWHQDLLRGIDRSGGLFDLPFNRCEACYYEADLDSALLGMLFGIGGDFLVLNPEAVVEVHGIHDSVPLE